MNQFPFLIFAVFCTTMVMVGTSQAEGHHKSKAPSAAVAALADPEPTTKTVGYSKKDIVKLKTKVNFTTLIVLPENERILDFSCGDKEFWIINGSQNFAYVKPAKEGSMTDLNLITASGNIFTFVLVEVSNIPNTEPDLKVFVEPKEESMISAASDPPRFISSTEVERYLHEIDVEKQEIRRVEEAAQNERDEEVVKVLAETKFTYHYDPEKKPFHVSAIYHDKTHTYIKAEPEETPTLYEIKDGKPNLVNFQYKDGIYIADKVIDRGYLAIGKSRLLFLRKEAQ